MTNQPPLTPCCGGGGGGGDDDDTATKPNGRPRGDGEHHGKSKNNNKNKNKNNTVHCTTKRKKRRFDKERDHVMIVGSGLAGLSCALSLEQAGYQNISLFERDVDFDAQKEGYGLTISYNPKGALAKLGLLEHVAQSDCPSRSHYIFEPNGNILGYFGNAFSPHRGAGQRGNLRIPRKVLRRLLLDNLQTTKVYWNHTLADFKLTTTAKDSIDDNTDADNDNDNNNNNNDGKVGDERPHGTKVQVQFKVPCRRNNEAGENDKKEDGSNRSASSSTTTTTTNETVTVTMEGDLLVAADGIRSSIVKKLYQQRRPQSPKESVQSPSSATSAADQVVAANFGLRPMGVRLILGIADFSHPLVDERGFYTLDGTHRLFTMPYESNRWAALSSQLPFADSSSTATAVTTSSGAKNRVMWQLSFGTTEDQTPLSSTKMDGRALQECVLSRCEGWHDPVCAMIQSTPLGTIWGTDLMDRDPNELLQVLADQYEPHHQALASRIVIVGDALHSMSPFKGQGANQALQDGPLLASWLERAAIEPAVKGFMREAVQRSAPIVQSSHQTARKLHHPGEGAGGVGMVVLEEQSFAGVRLECTSNFLSTLRERRIGAALGDKLDDTVARAIEELHVGNGESYNVGTTHPQQEATALELSRVGNTQGLRGLSVQKHARSVQRARDGQGRSCLHLAAMGGHTATCKWLLAEVACGSEDVDEEGKTALDYATTKGHQETLSLFHAWKNVKH